MDNLSQVRLLRKFNCKHQITYKSHLFLILRVQLLYEIINIVANCIINFSFHFHLAYVFTTDFWTTQAVASSNFSLALSSSFLIPYTLLYQKIKSLSLVKDIQFTPLFLHVLFCTIYNIRCSFGYLVFVCIIGTISITMSSFIARILEQKRLYGEIQQIEQEDRKTYLSNCQIGEIQDEVRELVNEQYS